MGFWEKALEGRVSMNLLPLNTKSIALERRSGVLGAQNFLWFTLGGCHLRRQGVQQSVSH